MIEGEIDSFSASQNFGHRNSLSFDEVELSTDAGVQRLDMTELLYWIIRSLFEHIL